MINSDLGLENLCIGVLKQAIYDYEVARSKNNISQIKTLEKFLKDNIYSDYIALLSKNYNHNYFDTFMRLINKK